MTENDVTKFVRVGGSDLFHGGNTGSNPVGDAKPSILTGIVPPSQRDKSLGDGAYSWRNKTLLGQLSMMSAGQQLPYGANGGAMKNNFLLLAIVSGALLTNVQAGTEAGYQPATVVSVESHTNPSNYDGGDPSDEPLQPAVNSYDVSIRLGGTVYRTSYESAFDALPSVFTPNHPVQVNLKGRTMFIEIPGDRAVEMAIEGRAAVNRAFHTTRN
jgi:hypothetical protein